MNAPDTKRRSSAIAPGPASEASDSLLAQAVVLVIDDEDIVRAVAAQMLRILGCRVLSAAGAREGLGILRLERDVAAVLLDNHMPEMNGGDAIAEIRRLRPELPVLLISGLSLEGLSREVAEDPRTYLLHKPYRFVQLQEALEEALSPSLA
jgi:CheY-like chemotaxis protein